MDELFVVFHKPDWAKFYRVKQTLGHGSFGTTYQMCTLVNDKYNCEYVIKSSRASHTVNKEIMTAPFSLEFGRQSLVTELFAYLHIAEHKDIKKHVPEIYDFFSDGEAEPTYYIVMERLYPILPRQQSERLYKADLNFIHKCLYKILGDIHKKTDWHHNDFHLANIMRRFPTGNRTCDDIVLIDWGLAYNQKFYKGIKMNIPFLYLRENPKYLTVDKLHNWLKEAYTVLGFKNEKHSTKTK